jgi:hypothetical protein
VLPTLMIPDSTWSYLNPLYNRLFTIKYVMEKNVMKTGCSSCYNSSE